MPYQPHYLGEDRKLHVFALFVSMYSFSNETLGTAEMMC